MMEQNSKLDKGFSGSNLMAIPICYGCKPEDLARATTIKHPAATRLWFLPYPVTYAKSPMVKLLLEIEFLAITMQDGSGPYAVAIADPEQDCWRAVRRKDQRSIDLLYAFMVDTIVYQGEPKSKWLGMVEQMDEWCKGHPEDAPAKADH